MANVFVEVANGYEVRNVMDDVKTRIDAIQNLAEEAEEPVLEEVLIKAQVMSIAVSANTDEATLRAHRRESAHRAARLPRRSRTDHPGLSRGVREYEISIEVSEQTLREYGIGFDDVANAVRRRVPRPPRRLRSHPGRGSSSPHRETTLLRGGIPPHPRDHPPDGSSVTLGEIATIRDGFEEDRVDTSFDGESAILINVFRVGNEDTLEIAKTVQNFIDDAAAPRFPPMSLSRSGRTIPSTSPDASTCLP